MVLAGTWNKIKSRELGMINEVADGIYSIDVEMWTPEYTSVYLVVGDRIALIETGLSTSSDKILEGIRYLGFRYEDIDFIIVTHIHLDHAGGAGVVARELPSAKIVVHKDGAKHLIDPSRLVLSAAKALGELSQAYGLDKIVPITESRVEPVDEGDIIDLGYRKLDVFWTPGHAPHHICLYDDRSNGIFTGDAVGIYYPHEDMLKPTTPPPDFDAEVAIETIDRLKKVKAEVLFFSHFGPNRDVTRVLESGTKEINRWEKETWQLLKEQDIAYAVGKLTAELNEELPSCPRWINEQLAPMMVSGYLSYFKRKGLLE